MFNSQKPRLEDLPTTRQLLRATVIAAAAAGAILVAIVLPSEYAIDPTGIGRQLGLTQMGEIKTQLAEEAAADAAMGAAAAPLVPTTASSSAAAPATGAPQRSDTTKIILAPGQGAEIKATMAKNAKLAFTWSVAGGHVNFDTHADAPGIAYHGYGKGKETTGETGELVAAFDGKHGWFWRNRSGAPVTITLRTEGAYTDIRRIV
ncbi:MULTISPECIES: hypothetical protein [Sphingomonadaceae]|uniref:hypothetical protein n=1 Tax=Sphingomonadales TaxID=204457 RepID=UPI000730784E|nr:MULTISPECIES: hypothetical protein [Sphingomonadaceae]KTE24799.1 transmembrane anchor protein [Sphingopyxis sp. H057]KTE50824.1 transmembrane anchor protein [Sphingopyxis sp. H073]KTE51809.1 transmembrane anchor protein [Sphingopyxis sp. H071]KTE58395.1 transmembrane anchor protein [Sphingopyxis sp. H107]KTE64375.1 transmembrane anchor protein [Sphingopyxis sp. H100]|tara:strand:+ start:387 stop:1001 length:615 start_codon:yes stop_codon:yes gene_type:complete